MASLMKLFMKNKCNTWSLMLLLPLMLLLATTAPAAATTCQHPTDMWGDANPNIFYICDEDGQTPLLLRCPEGRGYFNGLGYSGCLPYSHWPACLPAATEAAAQLAAGCDADSAAHLEEPWSTLDPNKFYMCPGIAAAPLLLDCAAGKGFVQTSEMVGCANWTLWRQQMRCEAYY